MANNVYVNNDLELTLETNVDISGASVFQIRYKKPNGVVGKWDATLTGTTQVLKAISAAQLNQSGTWTFKAYVQYTSGLIYQGDPVTYQVRKAWQTRD